MHPDRGRGNRHRPGGARSSIAALPCIQILGSDLIAFRGASLTGFAAGFALGDFREFFAFFLAVPADHRDDFG
jgi:hypothetical protein